MPAAPSSNEASRGGVGGSSQRPTKPSQRMPVISAVGGVLQVLVNLSPAYRLDEAANITYAIELLRECPVKHDVGLTL
jgi:hypothetical protein